MSQLSGCERREAVKIVIRKVEPVKSTITIVEPDS